MARQQYRYPPWTLAVGSEGDLGLASPPFYDATTSSHGSSGFQSGRQGRPPVSSDNESYELDE